MYIVSSYPLAVFFCVITMLCWGSWANTQKLAAGNWRFELFYWDYVIGILLFSILFGLTAGSTGAAGRPLIEDLHQASAANVWSAFLGGIVFNLGNILVVAAIAISGMAVAFPIGIGIALVLGVVVNYAAQRAGNAPLLFTGVAFVIAAILLNARAYRLKSKAAAGSTTRGILLAAAGGLLMAFFFRFMAASMDLDHFETPAAGKMTNYTAVLIFSVGILASNFLFNTVLMRVPVSGPPVSYGDYFRGSFKTHLVGVLGGLIWNLGNSLSLLSSGKAGTAISYGLGQGATLVAAAWGVFVWKEFSPATPAMKRLLTSMFVCFLLGLGLIVYAGSQ